MPKITLPDGSVREYDKPVSALEVAESIGSRLAKAAVGAKVDGALTDLSTVIERDAEVAIITEKTRDGEQDTDALYLLRHSAAHVMAEAIQRIVPGAQLVYGPPLEDRFYYDIRFPDDRPLKEGDFEAIEKEMAAIVKDDRAFTRYELPLDEGMTKLKGEGSKYKLDNAERAVAAGSGALSFYATGEPGKNWEDLCRGPHVPSTGRVGAFKILSLSSSYWHGDENSDRLTRVYGTAFFSKKDLDQHLERLEEAKKRDHRVLGKALDLFHQDDDVGQGLILWTPRGAQVRKQLQKFISRELERQGYTEVFTPHIGKLELYKTSGHFPYYQDSQFPPIVDRENLNRLAGDGCSCAQLANLMGEGDINGFLLKPMNCPHHMKIYGSRPRSYRDLPVRLAEFGTVYRWEQSGELNGMTRVRGFTQDDAHLFCTPEQLGDELQGCLELVKIIFDALGMDDYRVRVGLRDPDSGKYVGDPAKWDAAEQACRDAAKTLGVPFSEEPGEAAFYGPKIDFVVKDVIGREWQLGTVQCDYNLPERFDLSYIGADGQAHRPVVIHRAPFGSMERFIGVLIEHFSGAFPLWLAPEQVRVMPISEKSLDYGRKIHEQLVEAGFRATLDDSDERVQLKIRRGAEMKVPYSVIVGPKDEEAGTVSLRVFGLPDAQGSLPIAAFVEALQNEDASRGKKRAADLLATPAS
ncbi:MAG: threonine--tRNA ligase [Phycisphaerae bacterium]|nr:threonine--tRNA ligase [Phycisphaerae bacterium]